MFDTSLVRRVKVVMLFGACALAACGGSSPVAVNQPPAVEAGADVTVEENVVVDLIPVASDGDGEITELAWVQLAGPAVTLQLVNAQTGHYRLTTPDTGIAAQISLEFAVTATDDDDASASDTRVITVLRVNDAPAVNAGNDQRIEGLTTVTLNGAAADIDGDVVSYQWQQTAGTSVVLGNPAQQQAGFTAPSTLIDLQLSFTLTATDNEGASASDTINFTVTPENAPLISMNFPPPRGGYDGDTIAAFGVVQARGGSTISAVNVTAGAATVQAQVADDGSWRAENIPVPETVVEFTLNATAVDSLNLQTQTAAVLSTSTENIGSGVVWTDPSALSLDLDNERAWVMTVGSLARDVQFIPVDLNTGARGASITDITNEEQGPTDSANVDMIFNPFDGYLYYTISPANLELEPKIIRVHTESGIRELISGTARGLGDLFDNPVSLEPGPDGTLYVADYATNAIFLVDIASGDRSVLADESSTAVPVEFPLILKRDDFFGERVYVAPNWSDALDFYYLDVSEQRTEQLGVYTEHTSLARSVYGFTVDQDVPEAFYFTQAGTIVRYNPLEDEGEEIVLGFAANTVGNIYRALDYDQQNNLLYAITENRALYVIDVESHSAVVVSHNQN